MLFTVNARQSEQL